MTQDQPPLDWATRVYQHLASRATPRGRDDLPALFSHPQAGDLVLVDLWGEVHVCVLCNHSRVCVTAVCVRKANGIVFLCPICDDTWRPALERLAA
jgi:hypothetical protein